MKSWFTTSDLAGLPGLPSSIPGILKKAKKEHWIAKYRQGQGGGKEYHLDSLPAATQAALHFKSAPAPINDKNLVIREQAEVRLTELKTWQRRVFDSRLALFREFEQLQKLHGTNQAVEVMVAMARQSELPEHLMRCVAEANARKGAARTLSRSMILGWQRAVRRYGLPALTPATVEKAAAPDWAPYFLKCYQLPSNPTIPEAMEQMGKNLPDGMRMPSYHQILRWHNKRSVLEQEKGRRTGSAYRALKGHVKRDTSGYRPMTIGQCDGHSFKAYVAHPVHGRPFHPEVCGVICVVSKVLIGWSAGLAESALNVAAALRHAAMVNEQKPYGGILDILYTDNGSGNKAEINAGDVTGLFARIGTTFSTGRPGNPQGRGLIEKSNQSIWIRGAKWLPACTAASMDKGVRRQTYLKIQKDIKEHGKSHLVMSWPQFLEYCQQIVDDYNRRPHSVLPTIKDPETGRKRHMSPLECWAWHMADGWNPAERQLTEAEVEVLWLPRETRTVQRATVHLGDNHYYNGDLAHYDRRQVQVAYFPADASKVQVWDMEGRLICTAWWEKNLVDFFPKPMLEKAQEQRAKRREEIKQLQIEEIRDEARGVIEIEEPVPSMAGWLCAGDELFAPEVVWQWGVRVSGVPFYP
ncbi:MAG: Mu transposase C-terminal domain-containing protein, partial [Desulfobulbus sp.]|nr:Mu transposase C-terminal domain-containing protein [Desulfobulbus sp.]